MGKSDLAPLIIVLIFIEIGLWIFLGVTTPLTSIAEFVISGFFNLSAGGSFWTWIMSNVEGVIAIAGAITIGTLITTKNETALWAVFAAVFATYAYVFLNAGYYLAKEFQRFYSIAEGAYLLAFVCIVPLVIFYVITIFKFWKGLE